MQLSHHKQPSCTATISVNCLIGGLMFYYYCFLCQLIKLKLRENLPWPNCEKWILFISDKIWVSARNSAESIGDNQHHLADFNPRTQQSLYQNLFYPFRPKRITKLKLGSHLWNYIWGIMNHCIKLRGAFKLKKTAKTTNSFPSSNDPPPYLSWELCEVGN